MIIPTAEYDPMFAEDGVPFREKMLRYIERNFSDLLGSGRVFLRAPGGLERLSQRGRDDEDKPGRPEEDIPSINRFSTAGNPFKLRPDEAFRDPLGRPQEAEIRAALPNSFVLDGAMGTMIQAAELAVEDFGGPGRELQRKSQNTRRHPESPGLSRGRNDIVETAHFNATPLDGRIRPRRAPRNRRAATLLPGRMRRVEPGGGMRLVAGSMGPTTKSERGRRRDVRGIGRALSRPGSRPGGGGCEILLVETALDARNMKAAHRHPPALRISTDRPVALSATIETINDARGPRHRVVVCLRRAGRGPTSVAARPARGDARPHRTLAASRGRTPRSFRTRAFPETTQVTTRLNLRRRRQEYARAGWVNLVGGCCGTTPRHIELLAAAVRGARAPDPVVCPHPCLGNRRTSSGESARPGRRADERSARAVQALIAEGKCEAAEVGARRFAQAQVLDVCLQDPDRDSWST